MNILKDADLEIYCCHLEAIMYDMMIRFKDLQEMKIPK